MATPIFVVGKHRSGTTLLGNLLLDHPEVAGVHHSAHEGIHESAFFSHVDGRYGDLQCFENYVEFAAVMSKSDYFALAGVGFGELLSLYPATYSEVFRYVMDRVAEAHKAPFWVEKTPMHTWMIDRIGSYYPEAKFIGIQREVTATALSMLYLEGKGQATVRQRLAYLFRVAVDKNVLDRHMRKMERKWPDRVMIVAFEDLIADRNEVLSRVCRFLGIASMPLNSKYRKNTSFRGTGERTLRGYERWLLRTVYNRLLPLLPLPLLRVFKSRQYEEPLPRWFFKLLRRSNNETVEAVSSRKS